ncbi:MAG: response regulator transcription factor [Bacteroidia bacterium]|nr:response regulator transcription factor [Bacteroidia bacterium]
MSKTTNTNKPSILLVEDEPNFGAVLKNYLELKNFEVTLCPDGDSGYDTFLSAQFNLCILDVMMPKKDGFTLAKQIREEDADVPLIFLTAKSMKDDVMQGYKSGADDYITKPFDTEVLLMKINAILRRNNSPLNNGSDEFEIGKYVFSFKHRVVKNSGEEQRLSPKEAELLRMLCLHMNDILPRNKALKQIWGDDNYFNTRSMDVFITRLRKLFKDDERIVITNIHGKGFCMEVK